MDNGKLEGSSKAQGQSGKCPTCGATLQSGTLSGFCPACLLSQGTETQTYDSAVPGTRGEPLTAPEVARLFPLLEIIELIGAGGMGAVYKARQPALDRIVALKLVRAGGPSDQTFTERFNREARALARLSHPNIVAVHEFGHVEGHHFFLMEFVDGANLRQLKRLGRISPREALQIVPQICDALQYAHDAGVVHRDIKPENVLVDRKGRVKIADFGLAKILGTGLEPSRLTAEGQIMGTPHYMAPEQLERPLSVDHRADIYSLGVVFYELLTGDLPIGKFSPPSRKAQVDVRLDDIVLRALENDPERRYQQANEVGQRVTTVAENPATSPDQQQPAEASGAAEPAAKPAARTFLWAGFPVVIERDGEREVSFNGVLAALAVVLLCVALGLFLVKQFTGAEHFSPRICIIAAVLLVFRGIRRGLHAPDPDDEEGRAQQTSGAHGWKRAWLSYRDHVTILALLVFVVASNSVLPALMRSLVQNANAAESPVRTTNSGKADPAPAPQAQFRVEANGSGTHRTIQAAIDAAPEGAVVQVGPGSYPESLTISRALTLKGRAWTETTITPNLSWQEPSPEERKSIDATLRAASSPEDRDRLAREANDRFTRPVLRIRNASSVSISGIKITLPGAPPDGRLLPAALVDIDASRVTMRDCAVVGSPGNGIGVWRNGALRLENSLVAAVWNTGLRCATGVSLEVVNSEIRNCYYAGITAGGTGKTEVLHSRISGSAWHGIRYDNASPAIVGNLIDSNARSGIYASGRTAAEIRGNVFQANEMDGISCWYNCRDQILGNTFFGNLREGLMILGASEPLVASNIFASQPIAVSQSQIADRGGATPPDLGKPALRGNLYWQNTTIHSGMSPDLEGSETGSLSQDPGFKDPAAMNFTLAEHSAARAAGLGVSGDVPTTVRFPLQPEESAMIPDGKTRDSKQWKRPSSSSSNNSAPRR